VLADDAVARASARNDGLVAPVHQDSQRDWAWARDDNVGRQWRIDGDRFCLQYNPGLRSQPVCGAFEVARGQLYLDEGQGWRNAVDSIEWGPH
jgi:hypothetical protein